MEATATAPPAPQDRYWIQSGGKVMHRDHPGVIMHVDRLKVTRRKLAKRRPEDKQTYRVTFHGAVCSWYDEDGVRHVDTFHSKTLRPATK